MSALCTMLVCVLTVVSFSFFTRFPAVQSNIADYTSYFIINQTVSSNSNGKRATSYSAVTVSKTSQTPDLSTRDRKVSSLEIDPNEIHITASFSVLSAGPFLRDIVATPVLHGTIISLHEDVTTSYFNVSQWPEHKASENKASATAFSPLSSLQLPTATASQHDEKHDLSEVSTEVYEEKSSEQSNESWLSGVWHMEYVATIPPQFTEFTSMTQQPMNGIVSTSPLHAPRSRAIHPKDVMPTVSDTENSGEHLTATAAHFTDITTMTQQLMNGIVSTSPTNEIVSTPPLHMPSSRTIHQEDMMPTDSDTQNHESSELPQSTASPSNSLAVVQLDENSGYITTPGFDEGKEYPVGMNDTYCWSFNSSGGQVLLLSFLHFDLERSMISECRYDYLMLSVNDPNDTQSIVWKKCESYGIPFKVFNETSVCIQFVTDSSVQMTGFKIMYSILPKPEKQYLLDSGYFNCSAITPGVRSKHFDCNYVIDCLDRQDEMNCSYTSPECPGLLYSGARCYTSILRSNITFADAKRECAHMNQTLVSPESHQEWQAFAEVIASSKQHVVAFVGVQIDRKSNMPHVYRDVWKWVTGTFAFYINVAGSHYTWHSIPACSQFLPHIANDTLQAVSCAKSFDAVVICQSERNSQSQKPELPLMARPHNNSHELVIKAEVCTSGFFVQDFLSCDPESHCHDDLSQEECLVRSSFPTIDLFHCHEPFAETVHYTLLCDFTPDCSDSSDEAFCIHDACPEDNCQNGQCIRWSQRCDRVVHCVDESDETCADYIRQRAQSVPPPAVISFDGKWVYKAVPLNDSDSCPDTHFQCKNLYCLPSYLRCNGVHDCTDHEDEHTDCETSTCPGFFRCRGSKVCVHPENVCDGVIHCPKHDDEMLCNATCPQHCTCQGLAFTCTGSFHFQSYRSLRYLHISGAALSGGDMSANVFLVLLRLSQCQLQSLDQVTLRGLRNLRTLDLTENALTSIELSNIIGLQNLDSLVLSGNPLHYLKPALDFHPSLTQIDLSYAQFDTFENTTFANFPSIKHINLSNSAVATITVKAFSSTVDLRTLDLRGVALASYPNDMLLHLPKLYKVWADDFRLCCKAALPEHFIHSLCVAPPDNIASCYDLLHSNVYRVFLWIVACTALFGNAGSFVVRCLVGGESCHSSFVVFVTNLSMADFLMGVYLATVGVADLVFRGQYWWQAERWKHSIACQAAGFISLLSTEVSAFFICLITLDRFIVLHFPFSRFHFGRISAWVACAIAWTIGLVLAAVPLLPFTEHWNFYAQTGICIPLPFAGSEIFEGYSYSFSVMIVLNFVLFLVIAAGQASIYWSVRASSLTQIRKNTKSKDAVIARRLLTVVLSDFFCWFPTGILGVLAYAGTVIHPDISVAVAIFVMPFNSALNPFLYTFNMIMEKRRKATEARILNRLQSGLHSEVTRLETPPKALTKDSALIQIDNWLQDGLLTPMELVDLLKNNDMALNQWLQEGVMSPFEISSRF